MYKIIFNVLTKYKSDLLFFLSIRKLNYLQFIFFMSLDQIKFVLTINFALSQV